jgi:hypothetical protein
MTPDMTFEGRNGEKIAYEKYYRVTKYLIHHNDDLKASVLAS